MIGSSILLSFGPSKSHVDNREIRVTEKSSLQVLDTGPFVFTWKTDFLVMCQL